MRRLLFLAFTAATLTAGLATGGGPAAGSTSAPAARSAAPNSIGIRLLDVGPAGADDPRARLYIVDDVAPGATIRRRVRISNTTTGPVRLALYAGAATVQRGQFVFADPGRGNDLTSWTSVDPGSVVLRADRAATALVTVHVPRAAPAGERYGLVWAQTSSARPSKGG
ncbi:MAG: hypothetical protein ACQSGP_26645, partial [Frankia sp.]